MIDIEARMTRVGTTDKPTLDGNHLVFDFDAFGSTMPDIDSWRLTTKGLGLLLGSVITVREAQNVFCGPRLAFMLRSTGFSNTQSEAIAIAPHAAGFNGFVNADDVQQALVDGHTVIDVRSSARFRGDEADPRPNVRSGHIPGSLNMPYKVFIEADSPRHLQQPQQLKALFDEAGVNLQKPLIFSCGSGITACIGALAAIAAGASDCKVYDGSWSEWGANHTLPVAVA